MSKGYCGSANIVAEDEATVIYEYAARNLNEPKFCNTEHLHDGLITIRKDALVEPTIREKQVRLPSGRKKTVVKRIKNDVDFARLLDEKAIVVENSRFCWSFRYRDVGMIAMHLIFIIFATYQDEGELPPKVGYHV